MDIRELAFIHDRSIDNNIAHMHALQSQVGMSSVDQHEVDVNKVHCLLNIAAVKISTAVRAIIDSA